MPWILWIDDEHGKGVATGINRKEELRHQSAELYQSNKARLGSYSATPCLAE